MECIYGTHINSVFIYTIMCTCDCTACSIVHKVYTVCVCVCVYLYFYMNSMCAIKRSCTCTLCDHVHIVLIRCICVSSYVHIITWRGIIIICYMLKQFIITYQIRITCYTCFLRGYLILKDKIYNTTVCIHKEIYLYMYLHVGTGRYR